MLHYWQPGLPVPPGAIPFSTVPSHLSCIPPLANPSHPILPQVIPYIPFYFTHPISLYHKPPHPIHTKIPTTQTGMNAVALVKLKPYREHPEVTSPSTPTPTHKVSCPSHSWWEKVLVTMQACGCLSLLSPLSWLCYGKVLGP